ncbi:hypothetical protein ABK040_014874 [Willaertia magna]
MSNEKKYLDLDNDNLTNTTQQHPLNNKNFTIEEDENNEEQYHNEEEIDQTINPFSYKPPIMNERHYDEDEHHHHGEEEHHHNEEVEAQMGLFDNDYNPYLNELPSPPIISLKLPLINIILQFIYFLFNFILLIINLKLTVDYLNQLDNHSKKRNFNLFTLFKTNNDDNDEEDKIENTCYFLLVSHLLFIILNFISLCFGIGTLIMVWKKSKILEKWVFWGFISSIGNVVSSVLMVIPFGLMFMVTSIILNVMIGKVVNAFVIIAVLLGLVFIVFNCLFSYRIWKFKKNASSY